MRPASGGAAQLGPAGGGVPPRPPNPAPGAVNPGGSNCTTWAVTAPLVLGVHARGFTISCPVNGDTASAASSSFVQPGTGFAALGGWKVQGSRWVFTKPQEAMVFTAQSSARFRLGVPVTRGPYTSATSWMIHMIFESLVSSALIWA